MGQRLKTRPFELNSQKFLVLIFHLSWYSSSVTGQAFLRRWSDCRNAVLKPTSLLGGFNFTISGLQSCNPPVDLKKLTIGYENPAVPLPCTPVKLQNGAANVSVNFVISYCKKAHHSRQEHFLEFYIYTSI